MKFLHCIFFLCVSNAIFSQTSFSISNLTGLDPECVNPTTLQFGPDGRLYVGTEGGRLFVYTVEKTGTNSYAITESETIYLVAQIPNHNDDGNLFTGIFETRQVTGILVAGTAANPVLYVSSSDPRVGGGGTAGDLNLDTNSGIITKLTWNGTDWDKVDIVRGLPRSEENHAVNGLAVDNSTNTLYVAVGGITNAGAPSNNFAFSTEYALSAAIISINLNTINALPVRGTGNNKYVYDLPTLNDPTRADISNPDYNASLPGSPQTIDVRDPFGGNDGRNQAKLVTGGPVQIYSPGWRNAYDLVITKTAGKAGRMYAIDNGANDGWGGYPKNVGTANINNDYDPAEPGSTSSSGSLGVVNNLDNLHLVSKPGMAPIYAGHPNPIRANPAGAGLFIHNGTTGSFATTQPTLPVDWPPVPTNKANIAEASFLMPGVNDAALTTFGSSTNGIEEYTSTATFSGQMTGNLIAADFSGKIWRMVLNADGTQVVSKEILASGFGEITLDVTAQGPNEIFDGTIWVCDYTASKIFIFTPQAPVGPCTGNNTSPTLDDDNDGYDNADETANGTNPCNSSSVPPDNDNDKTSDKLDTDDDNDGIPDVTDVFHLDAQNGLGTAPTIEYPFLNGNPGTGLFGLGFTGMMSNGSTNPDAQFDIDDPGLIMGGAVGLASFPAGPGRATLNTQRNGFQFGYKVINTSPAFSVQASMVGPFFNNLTIAQLNENYSQGIQLGTGDQNNYLAVSLSGQTGGSAAGIRVLMENNGAVTLNNFIAIPNILQAGTIYLHLNVNPSNGQVIAGYKTTANGALIPVGSPVQLAGNLLTTLQGPKGIAVGLMASSGTATKYAAKYDYMNILTTAPVLEKPVEDFEVDVNTMSKIIDYNSVFSDNGGVANIALTVTGISNPGLVTSAVFSAKSLTLNFAAGKTGTALIRVRATDSDGFWVEDEFEVNVVSPPPSSALRINSGGPALASGGWVVDQYFTGGETYADYVPIAGTINDGVYHDERWGDFSYTIPLANGYYDVKLHFVEIYWSNAGERKFNLNLENGQGQLYNYDILAKAGDKNKAIVEEFKKINITDGNLTLLFTSIIDNAKISGIEIIPLEAPVLANPIADITLNINPPNKAIALQNTFTDDKGTANILLSVSGNSNPALVKSATISGTTLTLAFTAGVKGEAVIKIKATDSDGLFKEDEFKVSVIDNTPAPSAPKILKPIPDQEFNVSPADLLINLATVFGDDKGISGLKFTVDGNSNTALAKSVTISGTNLKLSFSAGVTGESIIKVKATDADGLSATDEFKIKVAPRVILINSGGETVDLEGRTWLSDRNFYQGTARRYSGDVSGSTLDKMLLSLREGDFSYAVPLANGTYGIKLYFTEFIARRTSQRRFNVNIENGQAKLTRYDVYAKARGNYKAVSESFQHIKVSDGQLNIEFDKERGDAIVSGIEIIPESPNKAPVVLKPIADKSWNINPSNEDISLNGVFDDDANVSELQYKIVSNTNPSLVDAKLKEKGKEDDDDDDDNKDRESEIEIKVTRNRTGTAIIRVKATDRQGLYVEDEFKIVVGNTQNPATKTMLINSGGTAFTFFFQTWMADNYYSGGTVLNNTQLITGTLNYKLFQQSRTGKTFNYQVPVTNGTYYVRLHFAEFVHTAKGKRVFDVDIENKQGSLSKYDILSKTIFRNIARMEQFGNIKVSDGTLNINLSAITDQAIISGIEIIPYSTNGKSVSLNARLINDVVEIDWSSPEEGMRATAIEKSSDGEHFEVLQEFQSLPSAKSLNAITDRSPIPGNNYYRLRLQNATGELMYSDTRSITFRNSSYGMLIYPNPNYNGTVFVELPKTITKETVKARILTMQGAVVLRTVAVERSSSLLLKLQFRQSLANGIYIVEVEQNGKLYRSKLMIQ